MDNFTESEIFDAILDYLWDRHGDSWYREDYYMNKQDFLKIIRKEALRILQHKKMEIAVGNIYKYGRCPECNAYMVKHIGKHGHFLGCINFPTCTYTRNLGKPHRYVSSRKDYVYDHDDEESQTFGDMYPEALGWGDD